MNTLTQQIQSLLAQHGWAALDGSTAVACRDFPTAVGTKRAHVYIADFGPDTSNVMLTGDYESEGSNVLGGCFTLVPRSVDGAALAVLVQSFADRATMLVQNSYAARLLRHEAL